MHHLRPTRRQLLQGTGGLVITFVLGSALKRSGEAQQRAEPSDPYTVMLPDDQTNESILTRDVRGRVDSWLSINPQGDVTIFVGKVELGTGIMTAFAQIAAEELDVPFARVAVIQGDTDLTPDQGYTAGSMSIQVAKPVLQQAAAEARQILLERAADRLGVPDTELQVHDGVIASTSDPSKSVPYGALVDGPFLRELNGEAPLKSSQDYAIVGQSVQRIDIPAKVTGGEAYVQDLRIDGMLHGRVVRPHVRTMTGVGATLQSIDDTAARQTPGVVQVVRNGSFVGVVAEREEQAIKASQALKLVWSEPETLPDPNQYYQLMTEQMTDDVEVTHNGDVDGALSTAAQTLEARYQHANQAHASIGPSCAVADVRADSATIYSGTQGVYFLRDAVAPLLGLDKEKVHLIYKEASGCYGHNGADDCAADAAVLSQAVGAPVRVQWMRQDEFAWEPKGPQMYSHVRGGLDAHGNIVAWDYEVWTPTHSTRPDGQEGNLLAGQLVDPPAPPAPLTMIGGDRNAPHNYSLPNTRVTVHWVAGAPLRPSALRSLGALANVTANESFVDELAAAAGADPIEFRLRHLADPRAIAVIQRVAEAAAWQSRRSPQASLAQRVAQATPVAAVPGAATPVAATAVAATPVTNAPSGGNATPVANATSVAGGGVLSGRGVAFNRYETTFAYAAVVAEVEVDPSNGNVRVSRVTVAHDCGIIINPDGLTNQIEGNVIQGISRSLKEEITNDEHLVTSLDWSGYHILTFPEVPDEIRVELINRPDQPAWGAGEITTCPMAAAIGNAIFDATGVRLRTVPFTPERVLAALQSA
jgi:nicotinate dehydrogenase subunit B